jgi:sporulation protein YlmC with PRC-barrel domain
MEASGLGGPTLGLVLVPGLVAAGVGSLVFVGLDSWTGLGTFSLALPDLPHVGQPTIAEFAWALVIGIVAAVLGTAIRRLALLLRPHVERRLLLATPLVGLAVGGLAFLYARTSGHDISDVLFSGQDQLGPLVSQSATYSAGVLVLLMACKGLAYSASLAAFRGGPVFPAMFLGAAGGMALSQLPGLTLVPGIAMGIGAMSVVLLRLPMTSVLLATLLLASDGLAVMPLVIVAVAVAYVASARLAPPPREQASKDQPGPLSSSSDDAAPPDRRDDHHDAPPGASTADAAEHGVSGRGGLAMSAFDLDDVSNWRGRDVVDQNGHAVGVITDLYVDDATGRPEWAGVKSGLFSHREVFVPLAQATPHGMRVQVPYDHGHIHDAPTINPDGHLGAEEEARLYEHYGLDYGAAGRSGADSEFIAPATDRVEEAPAGGAGRRRRLRKHVAAE